MADVEESIAAASETGSAIPVLHFRTGGLSDAEAFGHWRELMAPLFHIERARYTSVSPRGNLSAFFVGEIVVNRCTFNAQRLWRDPALIAATPDHLVLQYYRSGGFRGAIAGVPVCIVRGQVTVADLGREIDAYAATSDTIGLSIPKPLLGGIDPAALGIQLDPPRNRLLGGYMASLPKRLEQMNATDIPALTAEIIALLARVFAPGPLDDVTGAASTEEKLLDSAVKLIEAHLKRQDLSPGFVAERLGASRATLYRLFAPMGGIMRYAQERRLLAVRDTLNDPLDKSTLAQLANAQGFTSQAVLSRAFRARFGATPSEWRKEQAHRDLAARQPSHQLAHLLWENLGLPPRDPR